MSNGHRRPSFAEHFRKDYISGQDFRRQNGDATRICRIAWFDFRDTLDFETKQKHPKPIMGVHEIDVPLFINKSLHEALADKFGDDYDINPRVRQQLIELGTHETRVGIAFLITPRRFPDQWHPIGQAGADKLQALAQEAGLTSERVHDALCSAPNHIADAYASGSGEPADTPIFVATWLREHLENLRQHRAATPKSQNPPTGTAAKDPAGIEYEPIREEDIPF